MSETTTSTLPAEGGAAAPATAEQTPANITASDTGTEQPTPETPAPETPTEEDERSKAQKRIDRLTREKWEARREAAAMQARLDEIERQQQATRDPNAPPAPQDVQRHVEQRAAEMVRQQAFNTQCNETYEAGEQEFPDFATALEGFKAVGGLKPALVEAALETDHPHRALYHLGKDLEEAERIANLPPARMGAALAKFAAKVAAAPAPKPVSKAPAPIKPIATGGTTPGGEPSDANSPEWSKWFWEQRRNRRR